MVSGKLTKLIFLVICLGPLALAYGQQTNLPLEQQDCSAVDYQINRTFSPIHTNFKPLLKSQIDTYINSDSLLYGYHRDSSFIAHHKHPLLWRKLRTENFIHQYNNKYQFWANPLFCFKMAKHKDDHPRSWLNMRGVMVAGNIGKHFSFYSDFYENQAVFPTYIDNYIRLRSAVPGQGLPKAYKDSGHDFATASGYISFTPISRLNIQLGHGKQFVGEGYRSLLLSDNSINYPYFKLSASFEKWQYNLMWTQLSGFDTDYWGYEAAELAYHYRKHGAFTLINWMPHPRIQLGFFESVVFKTSDSSYTNRIPVNFFNPVPLWRSIQYDLDHEHNVMIGLTAKASPLRQWLVYGQIAVDQINRKEYKNHKRHFDNRFGYQGGIKCFDLLHGTIAKHQLFLQAEYNHAQPYMYAHQEAHQNYSHLSLPLAHPVGAGFNEAIIIGRYYWHDFSLEFRYNHLIASQDTAGSHFGSNIFLSDLSATPGYIVDNKAGQGVEALITNQFLKLAYMINPRTNLQIFAGLHRRESSTILGRHEESFLFLGIQTNLRNVYDDF